VWIDSGSTQAAVLKRGQGGTSWPADLYLEGSDQHRGWFQSSLWNSVIAFGAAPYKAVLTHGFIVDKNRQKISKSSTYQKPQTADAYIAQHGADVIRLWIASQDFRDDIPVDDEILKHVGEAYRLFRNTLRFQLSTLFDFDAVKHAVPVEKMDALDRWALHKTHALIEECTKAYDAYEFHRVYQLCNQFCSVTLSATYHDILKDRLYTLGAAHPLRRSSQTAIAAIFDTLVKILAPFITFTADEAWSYAKTGQEYSNESIHLQDWPVAPAAWRNAEIEADFATLFQCAPRSPRPSNPSVRPAPSASRWTPSSPLVARTKPPPGCWKNTTDFYPNSLSFQLSVSQPAPVRCPPPATPRKPATPAARAAGAGCRKLFTPPTEKFAPAAPKPLTPDPTPPWPRRKTPPRKSVPSKKPPPSRRKRNRPPSPFPTSLCLNPSNPPNPFPKLLRRSPPLPPRRPPPWPKARTPPSAS
jgi:hypothetical protein